MNETQKRELLQALGYGQEGIDETIRAEADGDVEIYWEEVAEDAAAK
jgi:hypothetical protein